MPFLPSDVAGLTLWLDALDDATLGALTGLTYSWTDKSGLGNHVATQAGRPLGIRTNPTDASKRLLRAEGGDGSAAGGYIRADGAAATINAAFTLFFVGSFPANSGETAFGAGNSGAANPCVWLSNLSGKFRLFARSSGGTNISVSSAGDVNADLSIYRLTWTGSTYTLHRNGSQLFSQAYSAGATCNTLAFGTLIRTAPQNSGDLTLAEVLLYNSALGTSDVTSIEAWLVRHLGTIAHERAFPDFWPSAGKPKLARFTKTGLTYGTTYDTSRHRCGAGHTIYFVDPVFGSNANPGSSAAPLKSINAALAKSDVDGVSLAPGLYHKNAIWSSFARPGRSVSIVCPTGQAVVCNAEEISTWTKTAGRTHVYEFARTAASVEVFDLTQVDARGRAIPYTSRSTIALVDANPGSWYDNGSTIYVHAFDSRAADRDIVVRLGTVAPQLPYNTAGHFCSVENVSFYSASLEEDVTGCNLYLDNVRLYGMNELSWSDSSEVYLRNVIAVDSSGDIFDYRNDVIACEIGCVGDDAGEGSQDNCTTSHNTARVIRLNGQYRRGTRNCHDIEATNNWYLACDSSDAESGDRFGFVGGSVDAGPATCHTCLERCTVGGNAVDVVVADGATVVLKGMRPSSLTTSVHANGTLTVLELPVSPAALRRRAVRAMRT